MRLRAHLLVYLFYLAVTLVMTFPLITTIGTRMIGHLFGDAYEYPHPIWWITTALLAFECQFWWPLPTAERDRAGAGSGCWRSMIGF